MSTICQCFRTQKIKIFRSVRASLVWGLSLFVFWPGLLLIFQCPVVYGDLIAADVIMESEGAVFSDVNIVHHLLA